MIKCNYYVGTTDADRPWDPPSQELFAYWDISYRDQVVKLTANPRVKVKNEWS